MVFFWESSEVILFSAYKAQFKYIILISSFPLAFPVLLIEQLSLKWK